MKKSYPRGNRKPRFPLMIARWLPRRPAPHPHVTPKQVWGGYPYESFLSLGRKVFPMSPSTLPFRPQWPELCHVSALPLVTAQETGTDHDWWERRCGGRGGCPFPSTCCPKPQPDWPPVHEEQEQSSYKDQAGDTSCIQYLLNTTRAPGTVRASR